MKKFKTKALVSAGKTLAGFEAGRRLSNGVAGVVPTSVSPTIAKAGIVAVALVGAAMYSGPQKDIVVPSLIGMASEQGGKLLDEQLAGIVPATSPQFVKDVAGLNGGGCGCYPPQGYKALAAPAVSGISDMQFNKATNQYELQGV